MNQILLLLSLSLSLNQLAFADTEAIYEEDLIDTSLTCTGTCMCPSGKNTKVTGVGPAWVACAKAGGACDRFCSPEKGRLYNTTTTSPNWACYDACSAYYDRCLNRCPKEPPLQNIYCKYDCGVKKDRCWAHCGAH